MKCPRCGTELEKDGNFRFKCSNCVFRCGLSFFTDNEDLPFRTEVGQDDISQLAPTSITQELIESGLLQLSEEERDNTLIQMIKENKLTVAEAAQLREHEVANLEWMMQDVPGQSVGIHRHFNGGAYRKRRSGGLIGRAMGAFDGGAEDRSAYDLNK